MIEDNFHSPICRCVTCTLQKMEPPKPSKTLNDVQIGGDHYKKQPIQPWDYILANNLGYCEGAIVKYVTRYKDKGGVEDLKKAKHFLEKLIEYRSTHVG